MTEAHATLCEYYRRAAAEIVAPGSARSEAEGVFDRAAFRRLGELGLYRVAVPRELGGEGRGLLGAAAALEGLSTGGGDLGFCTSVLAHLAVIELLIEHGNTEQRSQYLPRLMSGEWLAAVANSEPRAGTDVLAMRTRAIPRGTTYELRGHKRSITNMGAADLVIVSARIPESAAKEAINAFVLELPAPSAYVRQIRDLTGLRSCVTGDLLMRGVSVPSGALLGKMGAGVDVLRRTASMERLLAGYLFLSVVRRALSRSLEHAERREQFGQPIGQNQYVQERIVRMLVADECLSAMLAETVAAAAAGQDVVAKLSVIKIYGVEAALDAAQSLVRILGGRGLRKQALAEQMVRDVLTLQVFGGTVELHKSIAYRELTRTRGAPGAEGRLDIDVIDARDVTPSLRAELIALMAEVFPERPELRGRYFYDTPPDHLVIARRRGRVVGFRTLVLRDVDCGGRRVRVAGISIAVAPRHQHTGVGKVLTEHALGSLREKSAELVIGFLLSPAATPLLVRSGFRPLAARVEYRRRETGERVVESMPCYALSLAAPELLDTIERHGLLELGVGTW